MATDRWGGGSASDAALGLEPRPGQDREYLAKRQPNRRRFRRGTFVRMNLLAREGIVGAATGVRKIVEVRPSLLTPDAHPDLYVLKPPHPFGPVSGMFLEQAPKRKRAGKRR